MQYKELMSLPWECLVLQPDGRVHVWRERERVLAVAAAGGGGGGRGVEESIRRRTR